MTPDLSDDTPPSLDTQSFDELFMAKRRLEDLQVFAGQGSRMHPGDGWATVLRLLAQDLAAVRRALEGFPRVAEGHPGPG